MVVAIASESGGLQKAQAFATEMRLTGAMAYDSYEKMIEDDEVEAVYIGTVTETKMKVPTKTQKGKV